jgi:hypothetical protein
MIDRMNQLTDLIANIQSLLDGKEWTSETLNEIAALLRKAGYPVRQRYENHIFQWWLHNYFTDDVTGGHDG